MTEDEYLAETAKYCLCCPNCWGCPCGGCQAGGMCDRFRCRCIESSWEDDDEHIDSWEDDDEP